MAHFAQLDENNIVTRVLVVNNEVLLDENNNEIEQKGIDFLKGLYGQDTVWVKTSYWTHEGKHLNGGTPFRYNYAAIGVKYRPDVEAFEQIQPYPSWVLDTNNYAYWPPVPYPERDGWSYDWDEDSQQWVRDPDSFNSDFVA